MAAADVTKPDLLDIEDLKGIAARLRSRANEFIIKDVSFDLRLAASCAEGLSSLRFRILDLATKAMAHPETTATIADDLFALLEQRDS